MRYEVYEGAYLLFFALLWFYEFVSVCIAILAIAGETCRYIHVMSGYRWVY